MKYFDSFKSDTNILIKGDLTQVQTLIDIQNTIDNATNNDFVQLEQGTNELKSNSILAVMEDYATRTDLPGIQDFKYSQEFDTNYTKYMNKTTGLPKNGVTPDNITELYNWFFDNPDKNVIKDVSRVLYKSNSGKYEGAVIRIGVNVDPNDGEKITKLFNQFKDDVRPLEENEHIDSVKITSGPILTYIIMSAMNESQTNTLIITIIVAVILLVIVSYYRQRSIMLGIITMIPVILCVAWIWGSMFLLGIPLNVMTITIASLTIGLGITYSIHISHRFTEDLETKSIDEACRSTVAHTGTALFGAAATTIAGFGILVFSLLPPLQQFGGITAMTILYSFLASVFILPTFLVLWARYHKKRGKLEQMINGRKKPEKLKQHIPAQAPLNQELPTQAPPAQAPPAQAPPSQEPPTQEPTAQAPAQTEPVQKIPTPIQEPVQPEQPMQSQVQMVPCPICQNSIAVYTTPCPHCKTNLNW